MDAAAAHHFAAFFHGIGKMFLHFGQRLAIYQRANAHAFVKAVADGERVAGAAQFVDKGVIDAALHVEAVGADAGLSGVPEFADHRAFDGFIKIGIVKDDKGRVAAQFQRDFFNRARALRHELAADFGRAGEAEFFHPFIAGEHFADCRGAAGDDVKDAGRYARLFGEYGQRQRGEGRLRGGTDDEGAACR